MIGATHDLPGVAIVVDVTPPRQSLEAHAQSPRGRQFTKRTEIRSRPIDSPQRGGRDIAADQQQIGPKFLHQVELMLRANEIAPALRLGHALEIAKRLECANRQAEVTAGLPDVTRAAVERQQVILEDLDRVKSGAGDSAEFFVERTAQRDRGDRAFGHAICSRTCRGEIRARVRTTPHTASTTASGFKIEHPRSKTIT